MTFKPYQEKLNDKEFSIGISKKLPENSTNLAFASSPVIDKENIDIINFHSNFKNEGDEAYSIYYSDENNLLKNKYGESLISNSSIEITDEFTIRKDINDTVRPLFYKAELSEPIKGTNSTTNIVGNSIPYVYGYETKTIDMLSKDIEDSDKADITPLIPVVKITDEEGREVKEGFKIRLVRVEDYDLYENDAYKVFIYNSFDKDKTFKATYRTKDGEIKTEFIKSSVFFNKLSSVDELESYSDYDNVYAVKENNIDSSVYAKSKIYKVTDDIRSPHIFRYRIVGNVKDRYDASNKGTIKVGLVNIGYNENDINTGNLIKDFVGSDFFPEYINFINPHPDSIYYDESSNYLDDPNYWNVDLSLPQSYINEYDVLIISGYGSADLSAYNKTLSNYLGQGGSVLIDNLSNIESEVLDLDFGSEDPFFDYDYNSDPVTGELIINSSPKEVNTSEPSADRLFLIGNYNPSRIAATEGDQRVGPSFTLNGSDPWVDIIRYQSTDISVGYKVYNKKGRIYFSNCGITKAFRNSILEAQHFLVNLILTIAEDKWKSTPWIKDRVFHIDNLYEKEVEEINYEYGFSVNNNPVANKIISEDIDDAFFLYTNSKFKNGEVKYIIEAQEYQNIEGSVENEWLPANKVYMPTELESGNKLYAYALSKNNSNFNLNNLDDISKSDIEIYDEEVAFNYIIRPFTYIWVNDNGTIKRIKLEGSGDNIRQYSDLVSRKEGLKNIGTPLSEQLPPTPGGTYWAKKASRLNVDSVETFELDLIDNKDIFFEVIPGYYSNGEFIEGNKDVTIAIYDKMLGEYKYDNDGNNVISYNDLFKIRKIQTGENTYIKKKASEDIYIQVSTNKYSLSASNRVYSIRQSFGAEPHIKMPTNLNLDENWHPMVKYLNFIKSSFDSEDYKRISDTLRFRFNPEYIKEVVNEFYGEDPMDSEVISIISKLNNEEVLEDEDWNTISEAFDLIDNSSRYEYNIKEYHSQAWNPYQPVKKAEKDKVKYIDENTIRLQHSNIIINEEEVVREQMKKISTNKFKSANLNWLPSEAVFLEVEDENEIGGYRTLNPSIYSIDFSNGLVTTEVEVGDLVYANYKYSNIELYKKKYENKEVKLEECLQLDTHHYDIPSIGSEGRVLRNPQPKLYFAETYSELETNKEDYTEGPNYEIDFDRGFIRLTDPTTKRVFIDYHYEVIEKLGIEEYDDKTGIMKLKDKIHFNDIVFSSYYYEDYYYTYKGYYNGEKYMYLDLNPSYGHTCTVRKNAYGEISYEEVPTYELVGKEVYFYILPSKVLKTSISIGEKLEKISNTQFQATNKNWMNTSPVEIQKEVSGNMETIDRSEYTVDHEDGVVTFTQEQTNPIYATYSYYEILRENKETIKHSFDFQEVQLLQLAYPEIIILGSTKITNNYSKADLHMLDTRLRGGGLKEDVSDREIEETDETSKDFWDISDIEGPSYYGNGVVVINIPKRIVKEEGKNGGTFTKEEIEKIVNDHIALGTLPIIDYYE